MYVKYMLDAHFDHMWLSRYVTWDSWDSVRHHRALTHTTTDTADNERPHGTKPVSQTELKTGTESISNRDSIGRKCLLYTTICLHEYLTAAFPFKENRRILGS